MYPPSVFQVSQQYFPLSLSFPKFNGRLILGFLGDRALKLVKHGVLAAFQVSHELQNGGGLEEVKHALVAEDHALHFAVESTVEHLEVHRVVMANLCVESDVYV